jgi:hypothetical protein
MQMPDECEITRDQVRMSGPHTLPPEEDPDHSDHFFDAFLTCEHPGFKPITGELAGCIEAVAKPRLKQRRPADAETHARLIAAIAANLAYAVVAGFSPPIVAVPLRKPAAKRSRYEPRGFRLLADTVALFGKAGIVTLVKSGERGRASTIEPVPWVTRQVRRLDGLSLANFGRAAGEESIILARTTMDHITQQRDRERIDYADTGDSIRFRAEMRRVNEYLAAADIRHEGPPVDGMGRVIDASPRARFLHRTFNIPAPPRRPGQKALPPVEPHDKRFDRGGRLYHQGIFWQGLGRDLRQLIRIDGKPIAYLDFKSMFLRLAHIEAGLEPPQGDLYMRVAGIETPDHREGIKTVVNAMLFRDGELKQLPRDTKPLLPPALRSGRAVRAAVLAAFPGLSGVFEHGRGFGLMFAESQILVAALLRLIDHGITALPVHDGMMVAVSRAEEAETLINETARKAFGFVLPLERK